MNVLTYSDARASLKQTMETVCDTHEPTVVTRQGGKPVVMLSLEDYNSLQETLYLLSSPANARRLNESIAQHRDGKASSRNLEIPDVKTKNEK